MHRAARIKAIKIRRKLEKSREQQEDMKKDN